MHVIAEEPWYFTVFGQDNQWLVTYLLGGPVDVPVSVRLLRDEVASIQADPSLARPLVDKMRFNRSAYSHREIRPPVWPDKQGELGC
jgi:hypothetical protein